MIKKIILTLILSLLMFSCGKKGDPEYKVSKNNTKIKIILSDKV